MVGPPASGKSTFGEKYAKDHGMVYISTDKIRGEIGKNEDDQSVSAVAFIIARKRVMEALSLGKSVLIDSTAIDPATRKSWIKMGREYKAYIVAFAFEVDRKELIRRDSERERKVGEEVIDRFLKQYVRPTEQEVDKVVINPK